MIVAVATMVTSVKAQSIEEGIKMYRYERYETAKKILEPMATGSTLANYYLGLSELAMDNAAQAKTIFSKYPDDPANMSGQARVAYKEKNFAEGDRIASMIAGKALKNKKEWIPLRYAADAITYSEGTNKQQAIDWYKTALERKEHIDMRIALGDAYLKIQGGGGEAMNNYEKAVAIDPKNSLAYSRIGALWYAAKRYELALESYQKAKDTDPENPIPYRDLANAYFWVNKFDLARQNIEKYLSLSDQSMEDQIQYGNILYLSKDYPAAIQKMEELIQKGIIKPGFYGILAYSQLEIKDSINALNNVRKYFAVQHPEKIFPSDYLNYGRIVLLNGMLDSADYYFQKAVTIDTSADKADTYRKIAEAYRERKGAEAYAKAGEWFGKIVAENPDTKLTDYYYWGFWSYYGGKIEVAQQAFESMYAKDSTQPSAVFWVGRVLAASDEEAKTGVSVPYFTKWMDMPGEKDKSLMMQACQYLALYYYNTRDWDIAKKYLVKIEELDASNTFLKQLREAMAAGK